VAIRGDRDRGTQANIARAEQEGVRYLFKLRLSRGVKTIIERLMCGTAWSDAGQGWQGAETAVRLSGWSGVRRAIVLRRPSKADVAMVEAGDPGQLRLSFAELTDDTLVYEYAVLVTSPSPSFTGTEPTPRIPSTSSRTIGAGAASPPKTSSAVASWRAPPH
jgi:hypothetical protein